MPETPRPPERFFRTRRLVRRAQEGARRVGPELVIQGLRTDYATLILTGQVLTALGKFDPHRIRTRLRRRKYHGSYPDENVDSDSQ